MDLVDCSVPVYGPCLRFFQSLSPLLVQSLKSGNELWFDSQSDDMGNGDFPNRWQAS